MRNLKKVLSLVLVVAMIASMLIVGAAAAETVETTNYPEATEVMIGIGVIEGDENGYRYQDGVTREEAAKIIAHILLGAETADALKTSVAPFADVAATRWSAGYIAYLKSVGVISGVTDTTFDPTAPVTGVAFAKMMLTAVGYGKAGEFEGAAWDINTITLANQLGLYEGTKAADVAAAATREECMLYGFNTLVNIPTVGYNKTFEAYYVGTSPLNSVSSTIKQYNESDPAYVHTLAWKNYELEQDTVLTGGDAFGRPAVSWVADGATVADTVSAQDPYAVVYGSLYSASLVNNLSKGLINAINDGDVDVTVYTEGVKVADFDLTKDGPVKAGYYTNYVSNGGAINEIYVNYENGIYEIIIVVYYEHIAKVQRVSTTNNTMTIKDEADAEVIVIDGEDHNITGYAKNEYVLYTRSDEDEDGTYDIDAFAVVTPVVGTFTNMSYAGSGYVVDGMTVYASSVTASVPTEFGAAYEIYYNNQGGILKADLYDDAEATNTYKYFYVMASQAQAEGTDLINGVDAIVAYNVVYADGGEAIVNGAVKYDSTEDKYYTMVNGAKKYIESDTKSDFVPAGWYSFTTNENGDVSIKNLTGNSYAETVTTLTVDEGKASTGTDYTANSSTVLTVIDEDGNAVTYTGISKFPEDKSFAGKPALVLHGKDSIVAKNIVVYVGADTISSNVDYAYVVMSTASDDETVTYMAWVDGAMQFITLPLDNVDLGMWAASPYVTKAGIMYAVFEIYTEGGEYYLTYAGSVTNNYMFGYTMDMNTYATLWYETATIDEVDDNFFTTVAITDADEKAAELAVMEADLAAMKETLESDYGTDPDEWANLGDDDEEEAIVLNGQIEALEKEIADLEAEIADLCSDSVLGQPTPAEIYYYDADTVIYDCVNGGIATELTSGDVFMAAVEVIDGDKYCEYIWIVA